ncbi:MAG: hypothetical protein AAF488_14580 [Planctomycetota bacterium]
MSRTPVWLALVAALSLSGCILPEEVTPLVGSSFAVATQYNHRGMVQNEKGVAQGSLRVDVPVRGDGNLRIETWANMDLGNDTGDAWMPNGHGGKVTEVDLMAAYSRRIGAIGATLGVVSYILPNGLEFPNGERGTTTEWFLSIVGEILGVTTEAELHYDWDEVDGYYAKVGARKGFKREKLGAEIGAHLSYSDDDHSDWTYGLSESGFADVRATGKVTYDFDDRTTFYGELGLSTIIDSELRDWFDLIGIEENNVWLELGVNWRF